MTSKDGGGVDGVNGLGHQGFVIRIERIREEEIALLGCGRKKGALSRKHVGIFDATW